MILQMVTGPVVSSPDGAQAEPCLPARLLSAQTPALVSLSPSVLVEGVCEARLHLGISA